MEIVEIENRWDWGETINMICEGCGVCCLEFKDDTEWGYVSGLTVHPSRRRQGIAGRLMEKAEDECVYYGYPEIRLDVEKTRRFQFEWYKRLGYEVWAEDDELYYMKKRLDLPEESE